MGEKSDEPVVASRCKEAGVIASHDGNLIDDGTFTYTWDMENRLVAITPNTPVEDVSKRLEFRYDYQGRRIRKIVQTWKDTDPGAGEDFDWVEDTDGDHLFIYDQWNPLLVLDANDANLTIARKYTWGLDLSGQSGNFTASGIHGAGGIGGLLAVEETAETNSPEYWFFYDANGNVGQVVNNATGYAVAAHYEYDPYGHVITAVDADQSNYVTTNPFRFSTKWLDDELAVDDQTGAVGEDGMYYYGERYYIPEWGRWANGDPIEEQGGLNLYAFLESSPIHKIDYVGLIKWDNLEDTGKDSFPWGQRGPSGDKYKVLTDAGREVLAWKGHAPDYDEIYWCHGFTFGGSTQPDGPFSFWGGDVSTILKDDGWKWTPCCLCTSPCILIFIGLDGNVKHSGKEAKLVSDNGSLDEDKSLIESKRDRGPFGTHTLASEVAVFHSKYACYTKGKEVHGCCKPGPNETGPIKK